MLNIYQIVLEVLTEAEHSDICFSSHFACLSLKAITLQLTLLFGYWRSKYFLEISILDFGVTCTVTQVMAIVADFMLVWLPAPTVILRPSLAIGAGPLSRIFYNCPDNAFQVYDL